MSTPVPQPHGGMLIPGAGGGPQPGSGRPPSIVRMALRKGFEERLTILEEIADGVARFRIVRTCEHCGKEAKPAGEGEDIQQAVPRIGDRLRALEVMAKYGGIGPSKGLSDDDLRTRLRATLLLVENEFNGEARARVMRRLEEIWQ